MAYIKLSDNRFVMSTVLHVKSIPHESLFDDISGSRNNGISAVDDNRSEMANLLSQVYHYYLGCGKPMVALEILWLTHRVEHQPYKASVELYFLIRAIDSNFEEVKRISNTIMEFCENSLNLQWYELSKCPIDEFAKKISSLRDKKMRAVIKEERMEILPLRNSTECYMFDKIESNMNDFSKFAGTLINYPDSAVMIQLMPTVYDKETEIMLLQMSQVLSTVASGYKDPIGGQMEILMAQKPAQLYSFYSKERNHPLFEFNIVVAGDTDAVIALSSRVASMMNEGVASENRVNVRSLDLPADKVLANPEKNIFTIPWHISAIIKENKGSCAEPRFSKLSSIITIDECSAIFGLPIASKRLGAGFCVNEIGRRSRTYSSGVINSGDIIIGSMKSSDGDKIGLRLSDLAKHMFIAGTPGSGKTTFSVGLLHRLWKDHNIPFLVIEPAKNEYRALIQKIPDLQVFTPGKNEVSPFVFNPFVPPLNVKLQAYKSVLKTAFAAGVSMTTPLDKIFEDAVSNCYADNKWLDYYTVADGGTIFNISDFVKCFQKTFDSIGYTGDSRNIGRAGLVRLKGLEKLFDNYFSIPIKDILTKPTVIELAAIENADEKALYIALILLSILCYVNANYVGEGGLKNFILLEEAHVLLDADNNEQTGAANPTAIAQGLVKRMLAEIRSYGVGIAVADQSPRKVGLDILALTDIKVTFRLVENTDKQLIADCSGMDNIQVERLSRLKPGEAFFFFNKLESPEEIKTPDYRCDNKIEISLSDENIARLSKYWQLRRKEMRPYPECIFPFCCQETCDYKRRLLAKEVVRRVFNKHIKVGENKREVMDNLCKILDREAKAELANEPYSHELKMCIKVHLIRMVKYNTEIKLSNKIIENYLREI